MAQSLEPPRPRRLFEVTLSWDPDPEYGLGDYVSEVWAEDGDDAIRQVAVEMSTHPESDCETDSDRKAFVEMLVAAADIDAAIEVDEASDRPRP